MGVQPRVLTDVSCDRCGATLAFRGTVAEATAALDKEIANGRWERDASGKLTCTTCLAIAGKWGEVSAAAAARGRHKRPEMPTVPAPEPIADEETPRPSDG